MATAAIALAIDQISKAVVRASMTPQESVAAVPHVLNLTYVQNAGAAFGLFPGRQPVFILTSCFVLFAIAAYWRRVRPTQWPVVVALGLVAAGAAGNLVDRVFVGLVTDFFEFGFFDFPVFNIADVCILAGVAILMAWILLGPAEESDLAEDHDAVPEEPTGCQAADSAEPPSAIDSGGATASEEGSS
jgi:signal peptidase II